LGDMGASVLISLFLIPAILVFGLDMTSGPTLIFQTFPQLFNSMPGGRWVGSLFLFSIFIVAFLSLVAAYQVPYTTIRHEKPRVSNLNILLMIGLLQMVLSLPSNFFPEIIGVLDLVFGSGMQVFGSLLCIIGVTWRVGRIKTTDQMFQGAEKQNWLYHWIKWAIPVSLICVLIGYILEVAG
ncbi:MAG TPA: hypothetical protein VG737_18735, partial [Cyclobacteriaceae bacterium]|nr:hypothetical protein [Cyclobacteriaceae bacterium]